MSANRSQRRVKPYVYREAWTIGRMSIMFLLFGIFLIACGPQDTAVTEPSPDPGIVTTPDTEPFPDTTPLAPTPDTLAEPSPIMTPSPDDALMMTPSPDDAMAATPMPTEPEDSEVTFNNITDNPDAFIGRTVTLYGEVSEILGPQVFCMRGDDTGDDLIVVHTEEQQGPEPLADGTNVLVTGEVRYVVQAEMEDDFNLGMEDNFYTEQENRPAIITELVDVVVTVGDITDDPEPYMNQTVTVRGDVGELLGQRAFRFDDPALLGGGDVLVVNAGDDMVITEGDELLVTGELRPFDRMAIEAEVGADMQDDWFTDYEDRNMLLAEQVMHIPGRDETHTDEVTLSDISDNPQAFVGQTVTVTGDITEILDPQVFRLSDQNILTDDDEVLVVHTQQDPQMVWTDDATVQVTGTVRNFVQAEIQDETGVELPADLYAQYENRPVIIATSVTPAE